MHAHPHLPTAELTINSGDGSGTGFDSRDRALVKVGLVALRKTFDVTMTAPVREGGRG